MICRVFWTKRDDSVVVVLIVPSVVHWLLELIILNLNGNIQVVGSVLCRMYDLMRTICLVRFSAGIARYFESYVLIYLYVLIHLFVFDHLFIAFAAFVKDMFFANCAMRECLVSSVITAY